MKNVGKFYSTGICLSILTFFMIFTSYGQQGYWKRIKVEENMTDLPTLLKSYPLANPANNKFSGNADDMGMNYELNQYSDIDRKNHLYKGHVSWEWGNFTSFKPGDKVTLRGVVTNLSSEPGTCVSAYATLGSYGFVTHEAGKPDCAPPNGSTIVAGTAEVPKPAVDRNGNLIRYLNFKFVLSGGNEWKFVERTIVYEWISTNEPVPQPVNNASAAGTYKTDFGDLTISINGNKVTGNYNWKDGRIEGTLSGNVISGWWYQSNGKGKFIFTFNSNFSSFVGKWGNNNAEPVNKWNGAKSQ